MGYNLIYTYRGIGILIVFPPKKNGGKKKYEHTNKQHRIHNNNDTSNFKPNTSNQNKKQSIRVMDKIF